MLNERKPPPPLADRFRHARPDPRHDYKPGVIDLVKRKLLNARRFVLDADAARRYGEVVRDIPDLILREHQFARAPFDTCWFEIPFPVFYETVTGNPIDEYGDWEVGYLIDHETAYVIVGGTVIERDVLPQLMPLAFHLHEPWEVADQLAVAKAAMTSRIQLDAFLWGETYEKLDQDQQRALRAAHSCTSLVMPGERSWRFLKAHIEHGTGDLRNIIALMLLMNRPSLTTYLRDIPSWKTFTKGKLQTYLSHTVVTIRLDPKPTLRLIGTSEGDHIERRRHEVRGHYKHDEVCRAAARLGCVHDWLRNPDYPDDDDTHFVCATCHGKRWWAKSHVRGSAIEGFTAHDAYRITARHQ